MQRLNLTFSQETTADEPDCDTSQAQLAHLKVFKFGSSVLRTPADLARVAGEIYRHTLQGARVIAVVSALEGDTDALLDACREAAGESDCSGIAEAVSLGEEQTAALLKIACDRIGLSATTVRPEQFGICTSGNLLEATPIAVKGELSEAFGTANILILPGFVGIDTSGCRSLLGRGGTDFSAIFLGGELNADLVRLYKDVDGVFDHDPAKGTEDLHRFEEVSWTDCLTLARPLLQPKAIEYAQKKGQALEVGSIGSDQPTHVGQRSLRPKTHVHPRPIRIALAGYGTVGQALAERLSKEENFEIVSILVRDCDKPRRVSPPVALTKRINSFCTPRADVLVDLTSSEETGTALSTVWLQTEGHVITANKLVVGKGLSEFQKLGLRTDRKFLYSAAVGGSAPVLDTVRLAASQGQIVKVTAVLNGTVNFLLDQLASGASFAVALARAQAAGFAEEDPSQDLSGRDAELKLRIIAAQFSKPSVPIAVEALDEPLVEKIVRSGERWLQVSSLELSDGQLNGSAQLRPASEVPEIVPPAGERNLVCVTIDDGRKLTASGRGAGGAATAEAVMADLYEIWRDHALNEPSIEVETVAQLPLIQANS
ncbi:MAG TPA: hypothetical protein VMN38_08305 [Sphingomicrobium sp.]|nr:hypothetical protein [Sphingomicrobium sp.]